MKTTIFSKIEETIKSLDINSIPDKRKVILQSLIEYIQTKVQQQEEVRLNFVCTHNSRRSHLAQIWAQVMAAYFDIPKVQTYSGGTEATAMFPMVGETLKTQGFEIETLSEDKNPVYAIMFGENSPPVIGFSKTFDHPFNPASGFAAIMTCDSANEACPFIPGAEKRISIMYEDPKAFDNTPQQAQKYSERSLQIATELFYVFSKITRS